MKISDIRSAIKDAGYVRASITGGTPDEFKRMRVGPRLAPEVERLQALEIGAHFPDDIASRDKEIARCQQVIERWRGVQDKPAGDDQLTSPQQPFIRWGTVEIPLDENALTYARFKLARLSVQCEHCGRDMLQCATVRMRITTPEPVPHSVVCDCGREYPIEMGETLLARLQRKPA
jgi:hypothetical protein